MLLIVADTGPIRYLVQIGHIELLGRLFKKVLLPTVVASELNHLSAPSVVQAWMKELPAWVELAKAPDLDDPLLRALDKGEKSAIALGLALKAKIILMDDRRGVAVALAKGFEVTGTLGILDLASERRLIEIDDALERLKSTNFRYRPDLLAALLRKHSH